MKRRTLVAVGIILAVLVLVVVAGTIIISQLTDRLDAYLDGVELSPVEIASLEDGIYPGQVDAGIIRVALEVTMRGGRIERIMLLEHRNGRGRAGEGVLDAIIAGQETVVDTISGATYSSIVIMDAVQRALSGN